MNGTISKKECGKDKSLGAPGPLPKSCLSTYRDVFLATEYVTGGEEAAAEKVKDQVKHLFSKVAPSLSVIEDKSIIQKIHRCRESVKKFRTKKMTVYHKAKFLENIDTIFNIAKCQHKFRSCLEFYCVSVSCKIKDLHLDCACLNPDKIPKKERAFMQDQMLRCKLGDKGKFQMSIVDNRKAKRDARALDKKADIVEEVFEDDSEVMEDKIKARVKVRKVKEIQVLNMKMML